MKIWPQPLQYKTNCVGLVKTSGTCLFMPQSGIQSCKQTLIVEGEEIAQSKSLALILVSYFIILKHYAKIERGVAELCVKYIEKKIKINFSKTYEEKDVSHNEIN